jgi:type I restriction enzyme M protein
MSNTTQDIVAKLWNLCHTLRDDGVTYHAYVNELTYLLFLKMAKETEQEHKLPERHRWDDLKRREGQAQLDFYKTLLNVLGGVTVDDAPPLDIHPQVRAIYENASTSVRHAVNLNKVVRLIDDLDWYSARQEGLGDLYEGLLQKNANEVKSGAGQYFTPRPLIDAIVEITQPQPGEIISDPAAGTLGFIIAADRYIKAHTDDLGTLTEAQHEFQRASAYHAVELVPDTRRLAVMNAIIHNIEGTITLGNTLSQEGKDLPKSDLILSNPPFGTKRGGEQSNRDDFTYPTSNKQLAFLQHIYRNLKPRGRAAVVLPDNVLFEGGVGQKIRADLMDKCELHTIVRLPTGIFYAQGVKTNVLFFTKGPAHKYEGNTEAVWFYDLRAQMPSFGKRTPFTRAHLQPFVEAYGPSPLGRSPREDEGETGRFRRFTREQLRERGDSLDISWLKDDASHTDELPDPADLVREATHELRAALDELNAILVELGEDVEETDL